MKSEKTCVSVLQTGLLDRIQRLELTSSQFDKAIKIVTLIQRNKRNSNLATDDYVSIPATYWSKAVGSRYDRVMKILVESGIVNDTRYSWDKGMCKQYRINPELMTGSVSKVEFNGSRETSDRSRECRSTVLFMRSLRLDVRKAKAVTDIYISSGAYQKEIIIDPDIPDNISIGVHPRNTSFNKKKYYTAITWKNIAKSKGLWLIQDETEFFIDTPERYFIEKESNIMVSYADMIYRFQHKEFYARRNDTNQRLDSNLTSFPSILLKCFKFKGEPLVSIDLRNSQFVMLSKFIESGFFDHIFQLSHSVDSSDSNSNTNIGSYNTTQTDQEIVVKEAGNIIMTEDLVEFIKVAKSGLLYEYVQEVLKLPDGESGRRLAKNMMFGVCFSGHRDNRISKQHLRAVFPNVVKVIDRVKKEFEDNTFAILLQKMESKIFIDWIKGELDRRGFDTITKHDSVLCPLSQAVGVEAVVREILNRELGEYQLKIEVLE